MDMEKQVICGKCFLLHKLKDRKGNKDSLLFKRYPKCKGGWYF